MDLAAAARRQGGVFTRAQARRSGLSDDQVDRRLASGRWLPFFPSPTGVLIEAATPRTRDGDLWAGLLAAGAGAVLGSRTAAAQWSWCDDGALVRLLVPASRRPTVPFPGRVSRVSLPPGDVTRVRGLPLTSRARTLADCLRELDRSLASEILDRSRQRRGPALAAVAAALPARGHGCAQARALLAAADGSVFAAERRLVRGLRRAGITGWRANHPVLVGRYRFVVDVAFPEALVAVEVDGFAHHHDPARFQRDRSRQNALVGAGWLVLRFTWADLTERLDAVLRQIAAAVASRLGG